MAHKKVLRILCGITAALIGFSAAACSADGRTADGGSTDESAVTMRSEPETEAETEISWKQDIAKDDMEGYEFRMLLPEPFAEDIYRETEVGEVLNDAIYLKEIIVSDYFNITMIPIITGDDTEANNRIAASVKGGEDAYDMGLLHISVGYTNSANGNYFNLLDTKSLNMREAWWSPNAAEALTIHNRLYVGAGAYSISNLSHAMILIFNKNLSAKYNLPEPYEIVSKGEWTIDKLRETTLAVSADIDGNGIYDINDMYGFAISGGGPKHALMVSAGQFNSLFDEDGIPYFAMGSERALNIYNKYFDFFFSSGNSVFYTKDNDPLEKLAPATFAEGNLLYMNSSPGQLFDLNNMEDDFGILPMPKYDINQDKYYTLINNWSPCLVIPFTVADAERTGTIIEALARENYEKVIPVYADVVLKNKYSRDAETADMVDLIVGSLTFDMGYLFETGGFTTTSMFDRKNNDWMSGIEKVSAQTNKKYADFAEKIADLP